MAIIGFSQDLLSSYYNARIQQNALNSALASGRGSSQAGNANGQAKPGELPPWDVRGGITGLDELSRDVLGSGQFFEAREFSEFSAPDDHKDLFSLHQGLRRLYALASEASEDSTSATRRAFLDRRFGEGLEQLQSFVGDLELEELSLVSSAVLDGVRTDSPIKRGQSQYTTGVIHKGDFDAAVDAFQGSVQFQIGVTKNGAETVIDIDLADMGATERTMDNVAAHINSKLEAAGVITRFERVKIGEKNDVGVIPGNDFGFQISGVSTEKIRFDAAGTPSAYMLGISGGTAGQLSKIDGLTGVPEYDFIRRLAIDSPETDDAEFDAKAVIAEASKNRKAGESEEVEEEDPPALNPRAVAAAPNGEIYALVETQGPVGGTAPKGGQDLMLVKYDSTGKTVWTRALGAADEAGGVDLAVSADGGVILTGTLDGALGDTLDRGEGDAFAAKYSADGSEQWLQRFGTGAADQVTGVSVGDDGTIYVAGTTSGNLDGAGNGGGKDAYIRALGADGAHLYTRQFGGAGDQTATAVAFDDNGNLAVALKDGDGNGSIQKFSAADGTSAALWSFDLGNLNGGSISALDFDGGALYAGGSAGQASDIAGANPGHSGGRDGFLLKLTDNGGSAAQDYVSFVGSPTTDEVRDIVVEGGEVYLTGSTRGAVSGGGELTGELNSFFSRMSAADGSLAYTTQLSGQGGQSEAVSIAIDPKGDSVLDQIGLPRGTLDYGGSERIIDHTAVRPGDSFSVAVDGGRAKTITIEARDTYLTLTFKINAALVLDGKASVARSSEGNRLRIEPREGVKIQIGAGPEGKDALKAMGLSAGVVYEAPEVDEDDKASAAPPLYGLDIDFASALKEKDSAKAAAAMLGDAMKTVQEAYRKLTAPDTDQFKKPKGPVPAYLQAQLANFQAGLDRLNSGGGGSAAGLLL